MRAYISLHTFSDKENDCCVVLDLKVLIFTLIIESVITFYNLMNIIIEDVSAKFHNFHYFQLFLYCITKAKISKFKNKILIHVSLRTSG
jgi:hypothetical protein